MSGFARFQFSNVGGGVRVSKMEMTGQSGGTQRHFLVHRVNALNYSITTTESKQSSVATSARSKTQRGLKKVLQDDLHFVAKQQRQHIAAAYFSETQRRLEVFENCSNN